MNLSLLMPISEALSVGTAAAWSSLQTSGAHDRELPEGLAMGKYRDGRSLPAGVKWIQEGASGAQ